MSFTLEPLRDRIVVKLDKPSDKTASGLFLPETGVATQQEGKVIAVGPGRYDGGFIIPMPVKVDDKVIISKYGGTDIKVGGVDYKIYGADDILAIVH